jgi:phosphatidate cytidylyltransferase
MEMPCLHLAAAASAPTAFSIGRLSMLLHRAVTAAVLVAVLVPVFLWGGVEGLALLISVFVSIGTAELSGVLPGLKTWPRRVLAAAVGLGILAGFAWLPPWGITAVTVWTPLGIIVLHLALYHRISDTVESASQLILVVGYVAVPLAHILLIRRLDMGVAWLFFVVVVTCLGDAGAYFVGRYCGKHRFSRSVSPSKTIEGLGGGVLGNLVGMTAMKLIVPGLPPWTVLFEMTLLIAVAGPLGDLCASAIKRRLGIKDFGSLMPGHGGVMDRADSLIFTFPTVFYFLILTGHAAIK